MTFTLSRLPKKSLPITISISGSEDEVLVIDLLKITVAKSKDKRKWQKEPIITMPHIFA